MQLMPSALDIGQWETSRVDDRIRLLPSRHASCHNDNGCEEEPRVSWQERVNDQELIYTRAIGLLASSREINYNDVLAFE